MPRLSAVEGEPIGALGWIGLHEVLQEEVLKGSQKGHIAAGSMTYEARPQGPP